MKSNNKLLVPRKEACWIAYFDKTTLVLFNTRATLSYQMHAMHSLCLIELVRNACMLLVIGKQLACHTQFAEIWRWFIQDT